MKERKNEIKDERTLVNTIYKSLKHNEPYGLKKLNKFVNLANKDFESIWSGWYEGETPPKLEIDMISTFEDHQRIIDDALIIGVEIKYFKDLRGFYEGLGQIQSYSVFGFDALSLWHLFSKDLDEGKIQNFADATKEIIAGFNLPIFYICGRIIDEEELRIKSFAPSVGNIEGDVKYFVEWMRNSVNDKMGCTPS